MKKPVNLLTDNILFAGLIFFTRAFGQIPRKIGIRTGAAMGRLFYQFSGRYRHIAIRNLRNVRIHGMQHIRNAYEKGKGVLVLTAHIGNWEMLSVVGALIGYPTSIVYRPLDAKPLERFTAKMRTRFGTALIPKKRAFRKILKRLRKKEMVALLMDQNVAMREGVFAPFFNIPACTNKGLALLALKAGAPVVPIFILRSAKGYKGLVLPEIPLVRAGDKIKEIELNTSAYNQVIENVVRQHPEQWFWVHRRWNTRPSSPWPKQQRDTTRSSLKRG